MFLATNLWKKNIQKKKSLNDPRMMKRKKKYRMIQITFNYF